MSTRRALIRYIDNRITIVRDLSEEEYQSFRSSRNVISDHISIEGLFRLVDDNYGELCETSRAWIESYAANSIHSRISAEGLTNLMNRRLLNLLSSARTFLDHTSHRLVEIHGKGSELPDSFGKLRREAFDRTFSYRLMEKLRNFAQHRGFPLRCSITRIGNQDDSVRQVSLKLTFHRDELLADKDGWGSVRQDLAAQPPEFEASPHIWTYVKELGTIYESIARMDTRFRPATEILRSLLKSPGSADFMRVATIDGLLNTDEVQLHFEDVAEHMITLT